MKNDNIFTGLNVLEFAWVAVGASVGKMLGGWGATVIKVETVNAPCPLRSIGPFKDMKPGLNRSAFYTWFNSDKYSLSLNMKVPEGREVAKKLISWADVVTESYVPGTMEKWGLGYEEVKKIKPDIIYFSTCMQGQTGPHSSFRGYGMHMAAMSGYYHLTGWPDRTPAGPFGAYTDFIAMPYSQTVVLAALDYRRRTGKGIYIDLAQIESGVQFLGPLFLDYSANKKEWNRKGNRSDRYCPQGVYPCRGEDRWVAIAVANDAEWQRFCQALGNPDWTTTPEYRTVLARKDNEDQLDLLIGQWTQNLTAEEVTKQLQSAGVSAGPMMKASDLISDPQLKHRESFVTLEHPEIGPHTYRPTGFKLSKTPEKLERPAPCLGEHNEYVLQELLEMDDEELANMIITGALE